jgi:hypothetical protein
MADPTVPAPGPDTPTWTIDDDGELSFGEPGDLCVDLLHFHGATRAIRRIAYEALVADVRAARAHKHCGPATDTLRQARELAARNADQTLTRDERIDAGVALVDLLVDGGGDG